MKDETSDVKLLRINSPQRFCMGRKSRPKEQSVQKLRGRGSMMGKLQVVPSAWGGELTRTVAGNHMLAKDL